MFRKSEEAVAQRCSVKKLFFEVSQNSRKNTYVKDPNVAGLWQRCFPVKFEKIFRTPFLTEHLRWLLLNLVVLAIHSQMLLR